LRKFLACLAVSGILVGFMAVPSSARDRSHFCTYPNDVAGTKKIVSCFAKKFGVDPDKARAIAWRESNFKRFAWNHSSDCRGIFQHMYSYWPGRVQHWAKKLRHWHVWHPYWYNPRAQAVVTMAMVNHGGWGPWGG